MERFLDSSGRTDSIDDINWTDFQVEGISVSSYFESADLFSINKTDLSQPTDLVSKVLEDDGFGDELLEAKERFEHGESASYEEVFGEPQPDL